MDLRAGGSDQTHGAMRDQGLEEERRERKGAEEGWEGGTLVKQRSLQR